MSGVALVYDFPYRAMRQHLGRVAQADEAGWERARREIGEYFVGEIQDNLDRQRLFEGKPMPQSKAAIARAGKTLIDKHHLYDSYVFQLVGREGLEIGSASAYARIHHYGGAAGRGHKTILPARPVMGMTPEHEREIGQILIDEVRRTLS